MKWSNTLDHARHQKGSYHCHEGQGDDENQQQHHRHRHDDNDDDRNDRGDDNVNDADDGNGNDDDDDAGAVGISMKRKAAWVVDRVEAAGQGLENQRETHKKQKVGASQPTPLLIHSINIPYQHTLSTALLISPSKIGPTATTTAIINLLLLCNRSTISSKDHQLHVSQIALAINDSISDGDGLGMTCGCFI